MIELKLIQDNGIKAQLLEKMGIQASDAICYGAADQEEVLGGTAFAIRDGRAVMLGLFTEPGLGAMLGTGSSAPRGITVHLMESKRPGLAMNFPWSPFSHWSSSGTFPMRISTLKNSFQRAKNVDKPDRNPLLFI